jgi:hypothetical protein
MSVEEERIVRVESAVATLQRDLQRVGRDVSQAVSLFRQVAMGQQATTDADEDAASASRSAGGRWWHCDDCNARLGFYVEKSDELRIKYKEHTVSVRPGVGGSVTVPCVRCGKANETKDTRSP